MARRRKVVEETENHERWFVSYADFITLLFAFFTVMYALSTVNEQKYKDMSDSLSDAFSSGNIGAGVAGDGEQVDVPAYREDPTLGYMTSSFKKTFSGDYRRVQSNLSELEADKKININIERRGVVVSLLEQGVFSSGDAALLPGSLAVIDEIAATLKGLPNQIKVEGHSDNIPIHNDDFSSNWELSSARALNILMYMVNTHNMDPTKYSATGYGEFRPIADNDTTEGRAMNRRVDIVLFDRDAAFIEPM
ncbi:MAG: OmpA family protein [Proteobacteria bacterium]|nr:OmpA family protein [Pseudomonadota bacterium]